MKMCTNDRTCINPLLSLSLLNPNFSTMGLNSEPAIPAKQETTAEAAGSNGFDLANFLHLIIWFATSIYFNYLTPRFNIHLNNPSSASLDITMVELLTASAFGLVCLPCFGLTIFPSKATLFPMIKIAVCHLAACRLFVIAVESDVGCRIYGMSINTRNQMLESLDVLRNL